MTLIIATNNNNNNNNDVYYYNYSLLPVLRTVPCFLSPFLEKYDTLLRDILSGITNVSMGANSVWVQATLPVKFGRLGVRRATQLAPSAFLASAVSCSNSLPKFFQLT